MAIGTYDIYRGNTLLQTKENADWTLVIQPLIAKLNHELGGNVRAEKRKTLVAIENDVLYVDGYAVGNPGLGGYRVMLGKDGKAEEVIRKDSELVHTNNFFELYGILAGLKYAIANKKYVIYSDSQIALAWIKSGKANCTQDAEHVMTLIAKIQLLRRAFPLIKIVYWDTRLKGDIPADFGRK